MDQTPPTTATLLVNCRDRTGLVAALSNFVFQQGGNILDADQHAESESGEFFMRLVWDISGFRLNTQATEEQIRILASQFDLRWELTFSQAPPRVAVMVSKASHCLYDLMLCQQPGDLGGQIVGVLANHDTLKDVCEHFGVPFTVVPVERVRKEKAEARQLEILDALRIDLVVLARYM